MTAAVDGRLAAAWRVLDDVPDPEVPAVSVRDLGIVRDVRPRGDGIEVVLTPTYSGCPATEAIEASVVSALEAAGLGPVSVALQRAPAWTTDWITEAGKRKLLEYGIAPPGPRPADEAGPDAARPIAARPIRLVGRIGERTAVACPHCGDTRTERLSAFGSTACKALYRCLACREPFEYFKPI